MIKVDVKKDQVIITGHAGYDEFGKDIVCASVTSIATTTINAIVRIDSSAIEFKADEGNWCPGLLTVIHSEGGVSEAVFFITSNFSVQFHGACHI